MAQLHNYGDMIVATTTAIRSFLQSGLGAVTVHAAPPSALPVPLQTPMVNLFLFSDDLLQYGVGNDPIDFRRTVGAELFYLVSVHPTNPLDPDGEGMRLHGNARGAIESSPVMRVTLPGGEAVPVTLTTAPLSVGDLAAVWQAAGAPMQFAFSLKAGFPIGWSPQAGPANE